jgi:dihydroorotate dehydrogenase (fumarate)
MSTSALLLNGVPYATRLLRDLQIWLEKHEYESIRQMQGSMSHGRVLNPSAFERGNS